ncbi:MAG: thiamine phosphate synthase [Solirubrobacterales bacterium]
MGKLSLMLYPIIDTGFIRRENAMNCLRQALAGGADIIQVRDKQGSSRDFYELSLACHKETRRYGIPLIVNDRADIALAVGAEGVHLGQDDLSPACVRKMLGPEAVIGVSVTTLEEARRGERDGADYVSVSPVYATATKADIQIPAGLQMLRVIKQAMKIPVIAIGGIHETNIQAVLAAGADGAAMISAIFGQADPLGAARRLRELATGALRKEEMR